jgi:hypothetical protein
MRTVLIVYTFLLHFLTLLIRPKSYVTGVNNLVAGLEKLTKAPSSRRSSSEPNSSSTASATAAAATAAAAAAAGAGSSSSADRAAAAALRRHYRYTSLRSYTFSCCIATLADDLQ